MGINSLSTATDGTPIPADDHNSLVTALKGDIVPRNSSGVATANAGKIGTTTYPFKQAEITTGYLVCGQIIMFHDFNGALTPGHGWMKCNGDQVTEAAYDAIHGAGAWDEYIVSSPIENKYLPNFASKYPVGVASTTQDGSGAITSVGNSGHQVSLPNHTHSVAAHNHRTYAHNGTDANGTVWDSAGTGIALPSAAKSGGFNRMHWNTSTTNAFNDFYTENDGGGNSGNPSAATISHQPESIEVEYWMRII